MCFNHYIGVIIALFDPLFERIVYLTNSLVDTQHVLCTRDHMTTDPIEPFHLYKLNLSNYVENWLFNIS
jgi:hypothetical protein